LDRHSFTLDTVPYSVTDTVWIRDCTLWWDHSETRAY